MNYRKLVHQLTPGDTLILQPGLYKTGLPLFSIIGEPGRPIVIMGQRGDRKKTVFLSRSGHNTVSIVNSCYITVCDMVLNGLGLKVDAIKAEAHADWAHHITLENLEIFGHDADQQIVGINTKCPTWNWVIRRVIIKDTGTGIYLGSSDGTAPFINGLIEHNLIFNTIGYNIQIKHQVDRPQSLGMPTDGTTIIRHNVFSKMQKSASGNMARPNVLVGHWPISGAGSNDVYQIYGNFFYENPNEALFQGEGNIALYNNLFINNHGIAINIRPHNDVPKMIIIFNNTVVAKDIGIRIVRASNDYQQIVAGNAVFALKPVQEANQEYYIEDSYGAALNYLNNPTGILGELDLFPKLGRLRASPFKINLLENFIDWDLDFNGKTRGTKFRGAYEGEGQNFGWQPKLEIKTLINKK